MPDNPLGYSRDGDTVTLRMTLDDYQNLLLALGAAGALAYGEGRTRFYRHFALVNPLNAGNPQWTPYEIPDDGKNN